jgi:signal transduction histidine kinase/PAS domain-containing protein/ActR/RegA family two-component response regulator
MAIVEAERIAGVRDLTGEQTRAISGALKIWVPFVIVSVGLLAAGSQDYPGLHIALDMAMALVPAVLSWLLWHIGLRMNRRFPQLVSAAFALAALLNFMHVLAAFEWPGALGAVSRQAQIWRPATWGVTTHLLPLGVLFAFRHAGEPRGKVMPFATGMVLLAGLLLVVFENVPAYSPRTVLGISRPFLLLAPLAWLAVAWIAWQRRANERMKMPVCLMAVTLVVANVAMLYSQTPADAFAMIAHLGRVTGYLVMLLALMHQATSDMQARIRAEVALAHSNSELEARVQQRTAELARTNDSLTKSEMRFRAFVSATSDAVYRMSPDWSEMGQLLGQDFIADTPAPERDWLRKYIHPLDQQEVMNAIHTAIRNKEVFQLEHRVIRVDGSLGWTFSRAVPLFDEHGEILEWFGAASDVTPRREAEEKSRAQFARLSLLDELTRAISQRHDVNSIYQVVIRTLEQQLPVDFACICLYDETGRRLTVSRIGARSEGLARELAMPENAQIVIDQDGIGRAVQGQLVYEADISGSPFALPARLARGGLRALVLAPLSVEGKVSAVLITARKEAASFSSADCEFLRQLSEHMSLATHQARLYSALQQAYEDLRETQQTVMQQERLRALGQLASGIAHDINNALSPAALYAQSLLEREPSLSEGARQRLTVINRAIEDVGDTVARMRTLYRPHDAELRLAPVDLNDLLKQVTELTRARWSDIPQEHGVVIELVMELAADLPAIMGAETEIRDALTNLIFNAVDAMAKGGTLTLRTRAKTLTLIDGRNSKVVEVEVSDTGAGMSEDIRNRCLEPFFTTKGERGTGLGLAMVFGMVERHSADIEVASELGRGTTMRLIFQEAAASELRNTDGPVPVLAPLRLLLVDDDPVILQSLKDVLTSDGHHVTTADGGQKGIDAFRSSHARGEPFDLVFTDLGMPKIDGRRVASAIKAVDSAIPVVLLTGWGQRIQGNGELPEHVDRVLSKPPRLAELRAALTELGAPPAARS